MIKKICVMKTFKSKLSYKEDWFFASDADNQHSLGTSHEARKLRNNGIAGSENRYGTSREGKARILRNNWQFASEKRQG